jgi:hypothetical protein
VFESTDPQIVKVKSLYDVGEWRYSSTILHLGQELNLNHPAHSQSLYRLSYPVFSWLSLFVPDKCQDNTSNPVTTTSFHNLSNSLFTDHPKYLTNVS